VMARCPPRVMARCSPCTRCPCRFAGRAEAAARAAPLVAQRCRCSPRRRCPPVELQLLAKEAPAARRM
ncbi:hypothetical protein Dimus_020395, partial [Dionaea muscipula]